MDDLGGDDADDEVRPPVRAGAAPGPSAEEAKRATSAAKPGGDVQRSVKRSIQSERRGRSRWYVLHLPEVQASSSAPASTSTVAPPRSEIELLR